MLWSPLCSSTHSAQESRRSSSNKGKFGQYHSIASANKLAESFSMSTDNAWRTGMEFSSEAGRIVLLAVAGLLSATLVFSAALFTICKQRSESRKIAEKCLEQARILLKSSLPSDVVAAIGLLNISMSKAPSWWSNALIELKARALMRLECYQDIVDLLHDHLPESSVHSKSFFYEYTLDNDDNGNGLWKCLLLGQACFQLGRLDESLSLLQKAKSLTRAAARREYAGLREDSVGEMTMTGGGPNEALNRLMSVIKFLLRRRAAGEAAFAAGLHMEASRHFTKAIDARRGTPPALASALLLRRAAAFEALGRVAEAIADCNRAFALEPYRLESIWMRASLYESVRCYEEYSQDLIRLKNSLQRVSDIPQYSRSATFPTSRNTISSTVLNYELNPGSGAPTSTTAIAAAAAATVSTSDSSSRCPVVPLEYPPPVLGPPGRKNFGPSAQRWRRLLEDCGVVSPGSTASQRESCVPKSVLCRSRNFVFGMIGNIRWFKGGRQGGEREKLNWSRNSINSDQSLDQCLAEIECRLNQLSRLKETGEDDKTSIDHEKILGVSFSENASPERVCRVAALRHHPDRAVSFVDKCGIDDAKRREEMRGILMYEGMRLYRVVEKAREAIIRKERGLRRESDGEMFEKEMTRDNEVLPEELIPEDEVEDTEDEEEALIGGDGFEGEMDGANFLEPLGEKKKWRGVMGKKMVMGILNMAKPRKHSSNNNNHNNHQDPRMISVPNLWRLEDGVEVMGKDVSGEEDTIVFLDPSRDMMTDDDERQGFERLRKAGGIKDCYRIFGDKKLFKGDSKRLLFRKTSLGEHILENKAEGEKDSSDGLYSRIVKLKWLDIDHLGVGTKEAMRKLKDKTTRRKAVGSLSDDIDLREREREREDERGDEDSSSGIDRDSGKKWLRRRRKWIGGKSGFKDFNVEKDAAPSLLLEPSDLSFDPSINTNFEIPSPKGSGFPKGFKFNFKSPLKASMFGFDKHAPENIASENSPELLAEASIELEQEEQHDHENQQHHQHQHDEQDRHRLVDLYTNVKGMTFWKMNNGNNRVARVSTTV